jgi:diguanylate cyclase (GGDEF)-like protein/PAS domain S-box-containing protein
MQLKNIQLLQFIEQSNDSFISTDLNGFIQTWNKGSTLLFGYSMEEAIGKHITMLHEGIQEHGFEKHSSHLLHTGYLSYDTYIITKDKKEVFVSLSLSVLQDNNKNVIGYLGHAKDITYMRETQLHLEQSNQNLQNYLNAIDKLDIGIFVVEDDFKISYMNNTVKQWFGNKMGEVCYSSIANQNTPCSNCHIQELGKKKKTTFYNPMTIDGNSFDIVTTTIKNADGTVSKMEVIRNVTEDKKAKEALLLERKKFDYLAHHDTLTNLPNRSLFYDRLLQAIENAKHNDSLFALLFIDLDHFKEINDSLGHELGDEVLKIVAIRLKELIKIRDTLARLGGDEFLIIIEGLKNHDDASVIAKQIHEVLSIPIVIDTHTLYISSSIGISIYPDDGLSSTNLLKYADSAMYKAKSEGRDNYQYYNSVMTEQAYERVLMEVSLRDAIKNEEFVVYYQPQIDGSNDKLIGMEALVRWKSPTNELIPPFKFIPLAETTGLIVALDRVVMRQALSQLSKWNKAGYNTGVLALNLSTQQIVTEDFIEFFTALLKEYEISPEGIELEVTESQIMKNPQESIKKLQNLCDIGVSLAVDDFGTGYSSLAYLKKLPIDKLKIDQAFIRDLPEDEEDASITRAVIALATSLNLNIIAEGVETEAQRDFVVQNGCKNIQGYFYSKPIPAEEFEMWLKR